MKGFADPVGKKVELKPSGNGGGSFLPRRGNIIRQCADIHGNKDWFLVRLDAPFEHQLHLDKPQPQWKVLHVGHLLIRCRWAGHALNAEKEVSVFVLLAPDEDPAAQEPIDPRAFHHEAWADAKLI